jgi:hypothetical protein
MRCKEAFVAILVLSNAPTIATAQPDKVAYELQERCSQRATELFGRDFADNNGGSQATGHFENHYNSRLNKCFMIEESTSYARDNGKLTAIRILILLDVNENKTYATFDPITCDVQGTTCHSEEEWKKLTKSLMEE